ncbi:MAG: DUF2304 domain-containing protein [Cryobacterium sp.]
MNPVSYFFTIAAAGIALLAVIEMLRRQRFRERHAFWWLLAALLSVVVSIFPMTLEWASNLVGVEVPSNLAFFVSIIILFFVTVQHSSELTTLEEKTRTLAEHTALIEQRLTVLTNRLDDQHSPRER